MGRLSMRRRVIFHEGPRPRRVTSSSLVDTIKHYCAGRASSNATRWEMQTGNSAFDAGHFLSPSPLVELKRNFLLFYIRKKIPFIPPFELLRGGQVGSNLGSLGFKGLQIRVTAGRAIIRSETARVNTFNRPPFLSSRAEKEEISGRRDEKWWQCTADKDAFLTVN